MSVYEAIEDMKEEREREREVVDMVKGAIEELMEFKDSYKQTLEDFQIIFGTEATRTYFVMKAYEFAKYGITHGNKVFTRYAEYISEMTNGVDKHIVVITVDKMDEIERMVEE